MKANCEDCGKEFELRESDVASVLELRAKGAEAAAVACTHCDLDTLIDPKTLEPVPDEEADGLSCPVEACTGWAIWLEDIEDEPFWGCGSCGETWAARAELEAEIRAVLERCPHRAVAYVIPKSGDITAAELPDRKWTEYHQAVEAEWEDDESEERPIEGSTAR